MSVLCKTRKSLRRDFQFQIGRAGDLTCEMVTPEIASSPPTINFGVKRPPGNNTLEIKANTGSSRPNSATRSMEQRRSARTAPKISFTWTGVRNSLQLATAPSACPLLAWSAERAGALLLDRAGSSVAIGQVHRGSSAYRLWSCPPWSSCCLAPRWRHHRPPYRRDRERMLLTPS